MNDAYDRAYELLEQEHGGCDNTTCNIQVAMSNGYDAHAIDCFAGSGAGSDEFYELLAKVDRKWLDKQSRKQAKEMCKAVSHAECSECGATIWELEWVAGHCSSCGHDNKHLEKGIL